MHSSPPEPIRRSLARGSMIPILAGGLTVAALTSTVSATPGTTVPVGEGILVVSTLSQSWTGFTDWVAASYARAPALVLGLAALVAVPPLALIGVWIRRREADGMDIAEAQTQLQRVRRPSKQAEPRDGVRTGHIPLRPLEAWVEIVNMSEAGATSADERYSLARTLLRIGRETDNDICLQDMTVHRYHAAIHRTEDAEFVITDLSSAQGNGVVVNGRAVAEARLASGDVIELGNARLKFSAGPSG